MRLLKRFKNLWQLSRFEITEFDNQLVITKRNDELVFARPEKTEKSRKEAIIIKLRPKDEIEQILKSDE